MRVDHSVLSFIVLAGVLLGLRLEVLLNYLDDLFVPIREESDALPDKKLHFLVLLPP